MKIILIILFLIPLISFSQTLDTKVSVTLQARDCEFIAGHLFTDIEEFEILYFAMKTKFIVANPPANTTNVVIDTITIRQWLALSDKLRRDPYAIGGTVLSRYETALRAANNTFMTAELDAREARDTQIFTDFRTLGRIRLRRQ